MAVSSDAWDMPYDASDVPHAASDVPRPARALSLSGTLAAASERRRTRCGIRVCTRYGIRVCTGHLFSLRLACRTRLVSACVISAYVISAYVTSAYVIPFLHQRLCHPFASASMRSMRGKDFGAT